VKNVQDLTPTARLIYTVLLLGLGTFPILGFFDIGPVSRDDVNGPPWLALVAGGVFVAAAVIVFAAGRMPWVSECMGLAILVGFAAIGIRIAIGPGERVCSGGLSPGLFEAEGDMSGLSCRIPFGFGAVIVIGLIFWAAATALQKAMGGPPALSRTRSAAKRFLLVCLSPVIILVLLLLLVQVVVSTIYTRVKTGSWPRNESFVRKQAERFRR
jgi:hypothetical protein